MNLRPHHILCIQKFTGHGYSAAFTEHMMSIVSSLKDDHETQIAVTQGCDAICLKCPHKVRGACTSNEKVTFMDDTVLALINLTYGESISWNEIAHRAHEQIFKRDKFDDICGGCQWFELCRTTEVYYE